MKRLKAFGLGILAGVAIGLGGTVFLSLENKILGAIFFVVGLFVVCTHGFFLFTGKVCYVFDRDRDYALDLPCMWLGNFVGATVLALVEGLTRVGPALQARAQTVASVKLADSPLSIFLLALLCDIMIYIAVDGYANNPHELGKYLAIFFGVTVFILCGFEHCVANMYYFAMAGAWSARSIGYILLMTLGNAVGGVLIPLAKKALKK